MQVAQGHGPAASLEAIGDWLYPLLELHGHRFLVPGAVQKLLDQLDQHVVKAALKPMPLPSLTSVLRQLAMDRIPIRDLDLILDVLITPQPPGNTASIYTVVRAGLRTQITYRVTQGRGELHCYTLDKFSVEDQVRHALSPTGMSSSVTSAFGRAFKDAVRRAMATAPPPAEQAPVLLVAPDIRQAIAEIVHDELPELLVLSPGELVPTVRLVQLGQVAILG
jgi:type III secretory pathway component EscV